MCGGAFCSGFLRLSWPVSSGKEVYSEGEKGLFPRVRGSSLQPRGNNCHHPETARAHRCVQRVYQPRVYREGYLPRVYRGGTYPGRYIPTMVPGIYPPWYRAYTHHGAWAGIPTMVHGLVYPPWCTGWYTHHGTRACTPPMVPGHVHHLWYPGIYPGLYLRLWENVPVYTSVLWENMGIMRRREPPILP